MRTVAISSGVDANRLIQAAATERPTADTLEIVERAEQAALEAIRILAIQATDRSLSSGSVEWQRAKKAVERCSKLRQPSAISRRRTGRADFSNRTISVEDFCSDPSDFMQARSD
jgi:hypothetical protein